MDGHVRDDRHFEAWIFDRKNPIATARGSDKSLCKGPVRKESLDDTDNQPKKGAE